MTEKQKIGLHTTIKETVVIMSEGNPGGLRILMELLDKDPILILGLDDMNIRGWRIWCGFKDCCGSDIHKFAECIKNRDPEMVDKINQSLEMTNQSERAVIGGASFP